MDATATRGTWKRTLWQSLVFVALWGVTYLFAPLAPFLSLLLALLVCPAFMRGEVWFAVCLPLASASAFLLSGGDMVLGLLTLSSPYLSLLAVSLSRNRRLSLHAQAVAIGAAFIVSALAMLTRFSAMLGGVLFSSLADAAVRTLEHSVMGGSVLYRLVSLGILSLPDVYANTHAFKLGNLVLLEPALQRELLNMLRLRLNEGLTSWVPSLLMQGALITGLFTALSSARAHGRGTTGVSDTPRFQDLQLSHTEQGALFILCILTLLAAFAGDSLLSLLSTLAYAAFAAVYQLLGAAVLISLLARRHPERATLYGFLAALLYLAFPIALFMLGLIEQFIHLRGETPYHPKEE
jgi:hypothetical protein